MLYLLDANITITANSTYYPIDQVPEFWSWLQHQGESGNVKMPLEIMEELKQGRKDDPLIAWIQQAELEEALLLQESVDAALVQTVVEAYAPDLSDDELEQSGATPFLSLMRSPRLRTDALSPPKYRAHRRRGRIARYQTHAAHWGFSRAAPSGSTKISDSARGGDSGYPLGEVLHDQLGTVTSSFTRGMISSAIPAAGISREHLKGFQLHLTATNGNSGGPVFLLETGNLIGVLQGGAVHPQTRHAVQGLTRAESVYPIYDSKTIDRLLQMSRLSA